MTPACCCPVYREMPYQSAVFRGPADRGALQAYVNISENGNAKAGRVPYLRNLFFDCVELLVDANGFSVPLAVPFTASFVDMADEPQHFTALYGPAGTIGEWWIARQPSNEFGAIPGQGGMEIQRPLIRRLTSFVSIVPDGSSPGIPIPLSANTGNRYCDLWVSANVEAVSYRASLSVELAWVECTCGAGRS